MIELSKGAISQSTGSPVKNIPDLEFYSIGYNPGDLYSEELLSWDWEMAPLISPREVFTLLAVRNQFLPETTSPFVRGVHLESHLKRQNPEIKVDKDLYDVIYRAMDDILEWSTNDKGFQKPYTELSLRKLADPDGNIVSQNVHTETDFNSLSEDQKYRYVYEESHFRAILAILQRGRYDKLHKDEILGYKTLNSIIRNHPLYSVRKWVSINLVSIKPKLDYAKPLDDLISRRRLLEYST